MPVKQICVGSLRNPPKLELVETVDTPRFRHVSARFHHVAAEAASAILQNRNGSKLPASPDCATLHHEFASFHYNFATFHHDFTTFYHRLVVGSGCIMFHPPLIYSIPHRIKDQNLCSREGEEKYTKKERRSIQKRRKKEG